MATWMCVSAMFLSAGLPMDSAFAGPASRIGRRVDEFTLRDVHGRTHSLSELKGEKATVVAFLGVDCPLARLYAPRLVELAEEFGPRGVAFIGVDSNLQDSITEIAAFARRYGVDFPLLRDESAKVADLLGVERNPEVVVLDETRTVRYVGRIDDQYGFQTGVGYARPAVQERFLADALEEVLAGRSVSLPQTAAIGCIIGRPRSADADAKVTFSKQISRLFQAHCAECHREGQIAPFPLLTYEDTVGWAEMIGEVVRDDRMPPWHAAPEYGVWSNSRNMTEEEKRLVEEWVLAGAPEGDPRDLPEPVEYPEGWSIRPDVVIAMSEKPFVVPAEGVVEYQYFHVDPGFTEDKWVKAAEVIPGARSVVHHVIVFVQKPGAKASFQPGRSEQPLNADLLVGYAPGLPATTLPDGMAFRVPAGAKLIFQLHYTACGVETPDVSSIGLVFADPKEVRAVVHTLPCINPMFAIPPGADDYPVESKFEFKRDVQLVMLMPHMHLRGKAFRYDLVYPNGERETLLDIPRYDFNWQNAYYFSEPKYAPAGTTMHCVARYDNSAGNPANPDPTKRVTWGDQTWEEMMIGWFTMTTDVDPEARPSQAPSRVDRFRLAAADVAPSEGDLKAAERARQSSGAFRALERRILAFAPQVDRICIAQVDGDQVRFLQVAQSPSLNAHAPPAGAAVPAAGCSLADFALAKRMEIESNLALTGREDLRAVSDVLRSSFHVPIELDGKPALVSFWSREVDAFPEAARDVLEQLAYRIR
jgi:peroxiredoxin/mono/diheme cytochrome c family protein